jgi:ribosomal protein S18 acetylase RimI-like enzyme
MRIRPFEAADRPALVTAIADLQDYERAISDTRTTGTNVAEEYLAFILAAARDRDGTILVCEVDEAFAGFICFWVTRDETPAETPDSRVAGYISDVYVRPQFRGRRLALKMIGAAERRLAVSGVNRIRIASLAGNAAALAAYRRAGFLPYEMLLEKRITRPPDPPA